MMSSGAGMELWAIVPELILATAVLILLPLGSFLPSARKGTATLVAAIALVAAALASIAMTRWNPQAVFIDTYVVDPLAVFTKLFAITGTLATLLAVRGYFRGAPREGAVPAMLTLTCLGAIGLAASQDLVLIALFIQLVGIGSYVLAGIVKDDRLATEGALKLFLFSATAGAAMLYGMSLLYGLTGALRLPEIAARLPSAPLAVAAGVALLLAGYGFKMTLVPFHAWAPDTYQGAPTPIAGFLSVVPKAAGFAVLLRTMMIAFRVDLVDWPTLMAIVAALTMTVGNMLALRQTSAKRLLAYSSIAQAGYLLVGIAAARYDALAVPGLIFYLVIYLFMNLGAFYAVALVEQRHGSDDLGVLAGLAKARPWTAIGLTLCLLSLAGVPPLAGFAGKTMLFGAALGAGWTALAALMAANSALSLYFYLRMIQPMYFEAAVAPRAGHELVPHSERRTLRWVFASLAAGTLVIGVLPEPWIGWAGQAGTIWTVDSAALPRR
jgi:NADH-quinone oxidoreductase subunit N